MAKVPYIPLYIGDWEQDTNCLSPLAEFALLKLTFKLFKSENKGVFSTTFSTLSILFKSNIDQSKAIIEELNLNNILEFTFLENEKIEIKSRRMLREATISEIRAESGGKGGSKKKAKRKQTGSKLEAKSEQNADNDIDNDIDNIVKHLNAKSGKNFSSTAKIAVSNIKSRIKEGYTVENFKTVVDWKTSQWNNDPKMNTYLNPETLFGNKFDKYLNEAPQPKDTGYVMSDDEYEEFVRPKNPQVLIEI